MDWAHDPNGLCRAGLARPPRERDAAPARRRLREGPIASTLDASIAQGSDADAAPDASPGDWAPRVTVSSFNAAALAAAVRRVGDAALDPALWPETLDAIARATGSLGGVVLSAEAERGLPCSDSLRDALTTYVKGGWFAHDPYVRAVPLHQRGLVVIDQDIITPEERAVLPFFQEFRRPASLGWWAGIGLHAGGGTDCLALQRSPNHDPFTRADAALLARHRGRLNNAARLAAAVGHTALGAALGALERLGVAAVALGSAGRVKATNARAEALFDDTIGVSKGRLRAVDARAGLDLERLFAWLDARAEPGVTNSDGDGTEAPPVLIPRPGRTCLAARALPLDGGARSPFLGAQALLVFKPLDHPEPTAADRVAAAHRLTPAEARLAARLASGEALETAAEALGIARETARNQLKAVFAKTGTSRQAELVALLAGVIRGPRA